MSEIFINKLKTCAVSGHRKIEKIDLLKLEDAVVTAIESSTGLDRIIFVKGSAI